MLRLQRFPIYLFGLIFFSLIFVSQFPATSNAITCNDLNPDVRQNCTAAHERVAHICHGAPGCGRIVKRQEKDLTAAQTKIRECEEAIVRLRACLEARSDTMKYFSKKNIPPEYLAGHAGEIKTEKTSHKGEIAKVQRTIDNCESIINKLKEIHDIK